MNVMIVIDFNNGNDDHGKPECGSGVKGKHTILFKAYIFHGDDPHYDNGYDFDHNYHNNNDDFHD